MIYFIIGLIAGILIGMIFMYLAYPRKIKTLTLFIVFSIIVILAYTVIEFIFNIKTGTSHDTLTTCFYACFGGEILSCALIKIFKLKGENNG